MYAPAPIYYRFVVLALCYLNDANFVKVRLQTPFVCHLFLHYTEHAILKHPRSRVIRGLTVPWGVYFCFTGFKTVEQDEVGDTLLHTFHVPDWPICKTMNMITTGTVDGEESPSCGPIFSHHNPGPFPLSSESQLSGILWSSIGNSTGWGQKLTISNRRVSNLSFYLRRFANPAGEVRYYIRRTSDDSIIWWKKLMNANQISTTAAWYPLAVDPSILIDEEVRIYPWASPNAGTGVINIFMAITDVKPGEHSFFRPASGIYTEYPTYDFMYLYNYQPGWICI